MQQATLIGRQPALTMAVSTGLLLFVSSAGWAACPAPIARIVSIDNSVQIREASGTTYAAAKLNAPICQGDTIRVGELSRGTIAFLDSGLRLTIEQNTEFAVQPPRRAGWSYIDLFRGAILFFTRQPRSLDVRTPFVNAAVEGTEFLIRVEGNRAEVAVLEGTVALENDLGSLILTAGQSGQAEAGEAPRRIEVRPDDAVRWALYYEPIQSPSSLAELDQVPAASRDATYFVRRASALLSTGRVDEARAELTRGRQLDPNDSDAYALTAIIDIAQNNRENALENGRRAVALAPQSVSARLALSYALQAGFDLDAARDELIKVVPSDANNDRPEHALALAHLAELWLSLGYVGRALDAANRAVALVPDTGAGARLARPHTVLGFVELARVRTSQARAAFERAIVRESMNPLAHLGLGLAKIREGDLDAGRHEIETAAALDVKDAIIRSYLGKAYFEERRDGPSAEQLGLAKQLDPRDPTAYLYDAIRKQTVNRPVEALADLQRSIELNDNRAVYRSRFLLDADLAARSASLGRIYRDLGFEQLALVEGWKSLAFDPGDYSGHRLLSDTYSALPRHEVARVSELLQAQLLQPLNVTPVPPHLAEAGLFILPGAGPAESAFNEFNSLFTRNRIAAQVTGTLGQRGVSGEELSVTGVWNRLSFSAGQFHYDANGFRENNAQKRDIYNAFFQARLSTSTSIQAEARSRKSVTGDLRLLFNPEDFSDDERIEERSRIGRVGVRHVFSPASQVIASIYAAHDESDASASFDQLGETGHVSSQFSTDSTTAEIRHLFRSRRWNVTSGGGHFQSSRHRIESLDVQLPFPPFALNFVNVIEDDPRQTNLYTYSVVDVSKLTLTLGASADFYESRLLDRHQFNPKFGLIWSPEPTMTFRAAAFRSFQRTLVASQTIEPTQVAGFNQFFSDSEGEEAWRYGLAVDRKFDNHLFAGAEYSWRNLTVPIELVDPTQDRAVVRFDRSEQLARAYAYWTRPALALSAEYVFERFDRNAGSSGSENILTLRTHRVPLAIRYFGPNGWYASGRASYVNQKGEFAALAFAPSGHDSFWVCDAAVGYRLPKRYGRLAFEIKNLFDEQFRFQDTDPGNPLIKPARLAVLTLTVGI
jgi:tetratricopeptide (TPR) repeat protein